MNAFFGRADLMRMPTARGRARGLGTLLSVALVCVLGALGGEKVPSFKDPVFYPVGSSPWGLAVGDANEDAYPDLAVTDRYGGITIYLNTRDWEDGYAGLELSQTLTVPGNPSLGEIEFAYINNDQHLDLVVAESCGPGLYVFLNDGNNVGQFPALPSQQYTAPLNVHGLVAAHLDSDGFTDVALEASDWCGDGGDTVFIFWNDQNGGFGWPPDEIDLGLEDWVRPEDLVVGEFAPSAGGGPVRLDLVTANQWDDWISLLRNDGNRHFTPIQIPRPSPNCTVEPWYFWTITSGRFDPNGYDDVAGGQFDGMFAEVLLSDGQGGFNHDCDDGTDSYCLYSQTVCIKGSDSGHLNGGTRLDLAFALNCVGLVGVLLGTGDGKFQTDSSTDMAYHYSVGTACPWSVRIVDLNQDGFGDLVTTNYPGSDITVLINKMIVSIPPGP